MCDVRLTLSYRQKAKKGAFSFGWFQKAHPNKKWEHGDDISKNFTPNILRIIREGFNHRTGTIDTTLSMTAKWKNWSLRYEVTTSFGEGRYWTNFHMYMIFIEISFNEISMYNWDHLTIVAKFIVDVIWFTYDNDKDSWR